MGFHCVLDTSECRSGSTILILHYGTGTAFELGLPPTAVIANCDAPRGNVPGDLDAAIAVALAEPIDFPPLKRIAVAGDHVVLAIDAGVPQVSQLVAPIVQTLLEIGILAADITVLRAAQDAKAAADDPLALLPESVRQAITVAVHDPADRPQMSYLASTSEHHRIYLNRLLTDAELVLPIGCVRRDSALGFHGTSSGLYPLFSDQATQERFRVGAVRDPDEMDTQKFRDEVDEVGWLLGMQFVIQVVPGPGDRILHVLSGDYNAVLTRAQELYRDAWSYSVPTPAGLVIATVEGPPAAQSWQQVGRALEAAARVVDEQGSIVILSDLGSAPSASELGPALQWLCGDENATSVVRRIQKHPPEDAWPAVQLARALSKATVYLLSRLEPERVEDLGMAPVSDLHEVARLAQRHGPCLILQNAQNVEVNGPG